MEWWMRPFRGAGCRARQRLSDLQMQECAAFWCLAPKLPPSSPKHTQMKTQVNIIYTEHPHSHSHIHMHALCFTFSFSPQTHTLVPQSIPGQTNWILIPPSNFRPMSKLPCLSITYQQPEVKNLGVFFTQNEYLTDKLPLWLVPHFAKSEQ